MRWSGFSARVDEALHYQFDWAATLLELLGATVPGGWDRESFAEAFRQGEAAGRSFLVTSQGAWTCQRGVRFSDYLCLRTLHDGYSLLPDVMLFDVVSDPHEERDLAPERPELVNEAMALLADWQHKMMLTSPSNVDPLMTVLREGRPFQVRGRLPRYLERLRATGRGPQADALEAKYPNEVSE